MFTLLNSILSHLSYSDHLNIYTLPFDFPDINIGIFSSVNLLGNLRYQFLKKESIILFT